MINKIYDKFIKFIKENYMILTFYLLMITTLTYKLPYYITTGGGVLDTSSRIEIKDQYDIVGNMYFSYVSQLNATIPTYILATLNKDWKIEKVGEYQYNSEETIEEIALRDKIYMKESNQNAIYQAYKLANKDIKVTENENHIIYIKNKEKTSLRIGDILKKVDGIEIENIDQIIDIVSTKNVGEKLNVEIIRNNKTQVVEAEIFMENDRKIIGVSFVTIPKFNIDNEIKLKFHNSESGPSAGLMLSLTIYNKLIKEDITNGLKIVGTGTMEKDGTVGEIGGVKYKFMGAIDEKADIFIAPSGKNYEEVVNEKKNKNSKIKIIEAKTLEQVVNELNEIVKKND